MRLCFRGFATVAYYTFIEIYKSRILFNVFILGAILCLVCYIASEFTFGVPQRVALDFGLGLLSISGVGIAIFMGVGLVAKEIESRTVYMVLAKPLSRTTFIMGKIAGLSSILFLNIGILGSLMILLYKILGGGLNLLIAEVIFFSFMEALIVLVVVIIFSLITNSVRAVIFSLVVFIGGHTLSDPSLLPFVKNNWLITFLLKSYSYIFPNFTKINYKMLALYESAVPHFEFLKSFAYSVSYLFILLIIASHLFKRKELN